MQGTIHVYPNIDCLSERFKAELDSAVEQKAPTLVYADTEFHINYTHDGRFFQTYVLLPALDAPLPALFCRELQVNHVILTCLTFEDFKGRAGNYVGVNFGLPDAFCCINPEGLGTEDGQPQLYAHGRSFDNVVRLFRHIANGEIAPGHDGDPWNGALYV